MTIASKDNGEAHLERDLAGGLSSPIPLLMIDAIFWIPTGQDSPVSSNHFKLADAIKPIERFGLEVRSDMISTNVEPQRRKSAHK